MKREGQREGRGDERSGGWRKGRGERRGEEDGEVKCWNKLRCLTQIKIKY